MGSDIIGSLFHFVIGFYLFLSLNGIEKILEKILNKKNFFYSYSIVTYFTISYLIFLYEKKYLIIFSFLTALYYLVTGYKKLFKLNFILICLILLIFSLLNGQFIHGPTDKFYAWGLFDIYHFVSRIYQTDINFSNVNSNVLFGLDFPVIRNLIAFLGYQFSFLEFFDGFKFISISIFVFSILKLNDEVKITNLNYNFDSTAIILILTIFLIFSLPYPMYFFESPYLLLSLPIMPKLISSASSFDKKNYSDILIILFSLLITKLALISIYILLVFYNYFNNKKNSVLIFFKLILIFTLISFILPIPNIYQTYFSNIGIENINIKFNYSGVHKIISIFIIFFILFCIKNKFLLTIFFPSLLIYFLFPSASPAQLFFIVIVLIIIDDLNETKIFKINKNSYLYNFINLNYIIVLIWICTFLGFLLFKKDVFYYYFYFIIFISIFNSIKNSSSIIAIFLSLILLITSLLNYSLRQDNVLDINQKKIYLKIRELTANKALIFSDLNLSNNLTAPWGLYASIAERQFYISSFYSDYQNKFDLKLRNKMTQFNNEVIKKNKNPSSYLKNTKFKEFYILTSKSNPTNVNTDIIFESDYFKILKFK